VRIAAKLITRNTSALAPAHRSRTLL